MRAVVVSGGALRTTAPGASTIASSPCSIACRVETVLLNAMSMRPDCNTGTASAPLSNFETSIVEPLGLEVPLASAMTAPSDFGERQQTQPDLFLRSCCKREHAEQDQQRTCDASNDSHGDHHFSGVKIGRA